MTQTVVDTLWNDLHELAGYLSQSGQISFQQVAEDNLKKSLILSSASYFEATLSESVLEYVADRANGNTLVYGLVRSKAIKRQFHTWFDWDNGSLGAFQSMFGDAFKDHLKAHIAADEQLKAAVSSFLEMGRDRNRLVHQNYASFTIEKTAQEIYNTYRSALYFVEKMPDCFRNCE